MTGRYGDAMSDTRAAGGGETAFRRATEEDAYALAREMFLAGERVDMQTLAAQLGISRATLHRWVQTRENLLDHVLGRLAVEYFAMGRAEASGTPDDVLCVTVGAIADAALGSDAIRGFVEREPELALRLMLNDRSRVRRQLVRDMRALVAEVLPDEAAALDGFADAAIEVGLALLWPYLVAGDQPTGRHLTDVTRTLLAGTRAGAPPQG